MKTLLLTAMCLMVGISVVFAQIPQTMVLQGQLFQANGQPVPDGDQDVIVTLHAGAQTDDVIPVCNPCTVHFSAGVFTLVLGTPDQSPLPPMDRQYWVQLSLQGEALVPRLALHSVPYAMNAPGTVPVGSVLAYAGPRQSIPEGWMLCDGRAMSSKATPKLYEACKTVWGDGSDDGDPETDFNLPDLRGLYLRGSDDGARDPYAYARSHNMGPAPMDSDETLGTYAGTVEGFEGSPFKIRESPTRRQLSESLESSIAVNTPNAAVNYIIRVR